MKCCEDISPQIYLTRMFFILLFLVLLKYNWNRKWLYYYGSKLEGPSSWPLIGCSLHFLKGNEGFFENFLNISKEYSSVFKLWVGPDLIIVNRRPQDLEILLNKYLEKAPLYDVTKILLKNGLLTGDVRKWKDRRKIIGHTFNPKVLNTFVVVFNKHAKNLLETMKVCCVENQIEMFPKFWRCTLDMACETLLDVDSAKVNGQDKFISNVIRVEEKGIKWIFAAAVVPRRFWKYTKIFKYFEYISSQVFNFTRKVIEVKQCEFPINEEKEDHDVSRKRFLNHLIRLMGKTDSFDNEALLEEVQTMLITASESTAITLCFILIALAVHKDIQEKVYEELHSIFKESKREATLDDLNKMKYIERVIKETLRIVPPAPVIGRHIDEDIELNSIVYPKGSSLMIPITLLHKNPDLWDDPLTFNPDRFLPEENKNRHRCAYIPFSYGSRNCIGFLYGMISLKVMLSSIIRRYKVVSTNHKTLKDIKLIYSIIVKPKEGCKILLKERC